LHRNCTRSGRWCIRGLDHCVSQHCAPCEHALTTRSLMGQDEIYLQVLAHSGEPTERKNAARVLRLLKRGKHWVLVTLLLSNVITNETLPIVLDRSLGGGWPAVLGSTVLIGAFGVRKTVHPCLTVCSYLR
jgi:hypothetical protein